LTSLDLPRRVPGVGPEDEAKRFEADTAVFEQIDEKQAPAFRS